MPAAGLVSDAGTAAYHGEAVALCGRERMREDHVSADARMSAEWILVCQAYAE